MSFLIVSKPAIRNPKGTNLEDWHFVYFILGLLRLRR